MKKVVCPRCQGYGRAYTDAQGEVVYTGEVCPVCNAKGTVTQAQAEAYGQPHLFHQRYGPHTPRPSHPACTTFEMVREYGPDSVNWDFTEEGTRAQQYAVVYPERAARFQREQRLLKRVRERGELLSSLVNERRHKAQQAERSIETCLRQHEVYMNSILPKCPEHFQAEVKRLLALAS